MAGNNETIAMVLVDFEYLITLGNIGTKVATDIKRRIQSAHQREVGELCGERNGILNANASLAADNDRLRREVAELRECLEQAYGDKTGTYTMKGNEVERWRKALREEGGAK